MTTNHISYLVRNLEVEHDDGSISRFQLVYLDADVIKSRDDEIAYSNVVVRKFNREEAGYVYLDHFSVKPGRFKFV